MLNKGTMTATSHVNRNQILANVEMQSSVGCIVDDAIVAAADADGKKIAKAGTPIVIDLEDRDTTPVTLANGTTGVMNGVLLHDVDVTAGDANGTALLFGFVNLNRVDEATATLIATAQGATGVSPLLVFLRA